MPFFRFLIHGDDPSLPPQTRGFFTTRHLPAKDEETARVRLFEMLEHEFVSGKSAHTWKAASPRLTVEDAYQIGWHQLLDAPNAGSIFYDERKKDAE